MQIAYTTAVYKRRYMLRQAFCDWEAGRGRAIQCFTINHGLLDTNLTGRFTIFGGNCPTKSVQYRQDVELAKGLVIWLY